MDIFQFLADFDIINLTFRLETIPLVSMDR